MFVINIVFDWNYVVVAIVRVIVTIYGCVLIVNVNDSAFIEVTIYVNTAKLILFIYMLLRCSNIRLYKWLCWW